MDRLGRKRAMPIKIGDGAIQLAAMA